MGVSEDMKPFVYHLCKNIFYSFHGRNFLFHLLAVVLTAVIVYSGFDWEYFTAINGSSISRYLFPAIALGGLIPLILPLMFFGYAQLKKNARLANTGYALAQSAFLGLAISSFYKVFTGRVPPMHHMLATVTDISHQFQFGFMRGGVFWGWPSSHTTVAFATMVTFMTLYPHKRVLCIVALLYACYVGLGVSVGIHWFSEFVAGAIIGSVIGVVVGRSFLARAKSLNL